MIPARACARGCLTRFRPSPFAEIDKLQTSSLITRLTNDITLLQNALRMMLCMLVRAPLSCIGGLVMAIAISPRLSLIFVVAMPVLRGVGQRGGDNGTFPMFGVMQQKIDRVNTVMRENLLGVRVVKAFVGQEQGASPLQQLPMRSSMSWSHPGDESHRCWLWPHRRR